MFVLVLITENGTGKRVLEKKFVNFLSLIFVINSAVNIYRMISRVAWIN